MDSDATYFWAKTTKDANGTEVPGISVRDHCLNVGCVAEALIAGLPAAVRALLPRGAATLTALHDVGKITIGFLAKCPLWLARDGSPKVSPGEVALSVTDHALVSQVFLQKVFNSTPAGLWAVAVGAHHGRPKGKPARLNAPEALAEWAEANRLQVMAELLSVFGPLPTTAPEPRLAPHHSGLWLLAGLISAIPSVNDTPRAGFAVSPSRQSSIPNRKSKCPFSNARTRNARDGRLAVRSAA